MKKIYLGTATDAHGNRWNLRFLFTKAEFEAALDAGVIPEDSAFVESSIALSDEEVWAIAARQVIAGVKA